MVYFYNGDCNSDFNSAYKPAGEFVDFLEIAV